MAHYEWFYVPFTHYSSLIDGILSSKSLQRPQKNNKKGYIMFTYAKSACALLAFSLPLTTYALPIDNPVNQQPWGPLIEFAGNGSEVDAISRLREIDHLQMTMMNHSKYDDDTETFIAEIWTLVEKFKLKKLHRLLPVNVDDWNQISLQGVLEGDEYSVTTTHRKNIDNIQITNFSDSHFLFRTQEVPMDDGPNHYIINNQIKLGFGAQSWQSMRNATNESLRLITSSTLPKTQQVGGDDIHEKVKALNINLDSQDLEVVSSFWSAFPNIWGFISSVGVVNDIILEEESTNEFKHLNISFSLDDGKTAASYPALTSYLEDLEDLLDASLEIHNSNGQLLKISIDTTAKRGNVKLVIGSEGLIPTNGDVLSTKTPHKFDDNSHQLTGVVNANVEILGVKTKISDLVSTIDYIPSADKVQANMQINKAPTVEVSGAALGIFPTAMLDVFMPTNIDEIIGEFFEIACKGNDGQGIINNLELRNIDSSNQNGFTQLSVDTRFETISNLFVRIGMNIVNGRLIPSKDASNDIDKFINDARIAFNNDINLYENTIRAKSVASRL
ncbi:hypothetical protein A9Q99_26800 [Gammaproteobacteria bacterium 45_16_T64]|nr:hypothetical protein A9Q99_26800 [Gammaproteobacteria bacterium 45_16_T64]